MSDTGRLIYHSNYDKTPIQAQAAERIDLKGTVNMCRADDGFLTACEGWQNLIKVKQIVPYTFCIPQHLWDHIKRRQRGGSGNLNNTYKGYFAPQMML